MPGFDYSKWDKIELSDDEDDVHPNIDKDSWFRLKHRTRVENEEEDDKKRTALEHKLAKINEDLKTFGEAGKGHMKAQKLQKEADDINAQLEKMEKDKKWNADNMCKTAENRSLVSESKVTPGPEPRLNGEAVAAGYCEFVEEHEELLEKYISMGEEDDLEKVCDFLKEHGGILLQGEHAESYLLLDCLEKEMNGDHNGMVKSARQNQFLCQLREYSRAAGRPARDGVHPIFEKLIEVEETRRHFDETVDAFIKRVEKRAVEKKKEMDAEEETVAVGEVGPGGLSPQEVFRSLPDAMKKAFEAQDIQQLHSVIESLPVEEAKYHMKRCEDSGLWVPSAAHGAPPYRQD